MNILWDFDGTICNTYPSYTRALMEIIGDGYTEEETLAQLKLSFGNAFRFFKISEEQSRKFLQQVRGLKPEEFLPFPGVEEVLAKANSNVIMTHKEKEDVEKVLRHFNLRHYFAEIVGKEDGFPRKPDLKAYEYLHEKYGLSLVIGDRAIDLEPARRLGITTVSFQNHESEADFYLDDFREFGSVVAPYVE
ncbi:HAD family hydrolase [Neobacillus notoginsengisoli]|uniref:HAD family hydrolase n=1 Tax=Neobacillus notoginsengisoli TaxID=1578198 RepID=A0A417YRZ3_9BACI|nr:HAD-IA family hydrolase [Neobacillus notoginsengisoli]RHW38068.1 HAD family hydrolase [Neobacillus notoginsengisoli]